MENVICPKCHKTVGINIDTPFINSKMSIAVSEYKAVSNAPYYARIDIASVCPLCECDFTMQIPVSSVCGRDPYRSTWIVG